MLKFLFYIIKLQKKLIVWLLHKQFVLKKLQKKYKKKTNIKIINKK